MSLTLTDIPAVMRHHKWHSGARLMEIWFSRKAAVKPLFGQPDTATLSMDKWVLTFRRARDVYDTLMKERVWANEPARRRLVGLLRSQTLLGRTRLPFGALGDPVPVQDAAYVNFRAVGFGP